MGGCCTTPEDDVVEYSDTMNSSVMCKCGAGGVRTKVSTDPHKNVISVSGTGSVLGII